MTEVTWSPNRPGILEQGFTGVSPEFRNKGLGCWLKAAMLDKILSRLREVRIVRVNNAKSNAPMLKINRALGFRPYLASAIWQVELDSVQKYLAARS
jgi:GNAT superfamily N-acetyltransferase